MSAAADGWTEANRYQHPLGADENESLPVACASGTDVDAI
jgi:hypothetical protein